MCKKEKVCTCTKQLTIIYIIVPIKGIPTSIYREIEKKIHNATLACLFIHWRLNAKILLFFQRATASTDIVDWNNSCSQQYISRNVKRKRRRRWNRRRAQNKAKCPREKKTKTNTSNYYVMLCYFANSIRIIDVWIFDTKLTISCVSFVHHTHTCISFHVSAEPWPYRVKIQYIHT